MISDDHLAGQRPVVFYVADHESELAHSQTTLENNRNLQLSEGSNRKSSDIDVPESSLSHNYNSSALFLLEGF